MKASVYRSTLLPLSTRSLHDGRLSPVGSSGSVVIVAVTLSGSSITDGYTNTNASFSFFNFFENTQQSYLNKCLKQSLIVKTFKIHKIHLL